MKFSVRAVCFTGLFTAVTAVLSILSIPTPWGVPFTLQTFAMALSGYVLGARYGTLSTALYVLLGLVGVPVYAGMKAGPAVLFGPTGGYLFGFILMTLLCGLGMRLAESKKRGIVYLVLFSALGLAACHIPGILQFMLVMNRASGGSTYSFASAAMVASVPYLLKDALSVAAAYLIALAVRKALKAANFSLFSQNKSIT